MDDRVPKESRIFGLLSISVGVAAFGAQHWTPPAFVFIGALILAALLMIAAIFSLPSMAWRLAKSPPTVEKTNASIVPPNFVSEIFEADDMLRYQLATQINVEDWIDRVFNKLINWKPSAAAIFRPFVIPELYVSYTKSPTEQTADLKYVLEGIREGFRDDEFPTAYYDPAMAMLKEHLDRLIQVIS